MKIFLDDERFPIQVYKYTNIPIYQEEWQIVRNFKDFTFFVRRNNTLITHISFDHDLGEDETRKLVEGGMSKRKARATKKLCKSGMDCAKWLIEYCQEKKYPLPIYYVHSQNPVGKQNILALLDNFKKFQDEKK